MQKSLLVAPAAMLAPLALFFFWGGGPPTCWQIDGICCRMLWLIQFGTKSGQCGLMVQMCMCMHVHIYSMCDEGILMHP